MSASPLAFKPKTDNSIKLHISKLNADGSKTDQNITGWTVTFLLKKNLGDLDAAALLTIPVTSHSAPTTGDTFIPLTASQLDLSTRSYYGTIRLVDASLKARDTGYFPIVISNGASSDASSNGLAVAICDTSLTLVMAGPAGKDASVQVTVASTAPSNPKIGDLWVNTS